MMNEELTKLFSNVTNFYDITYTSLCDYCAHHAPATCGYAICDKYNPHIKGLTSKIQSCEEFELETNIGLISRHLCKTCDHCYWYLIPEWKVEIPRCKMHNEVGIADIYDCEHYTPHKLFITKKEDDEK